MSVYIDDIYSAKVFHWLMFLKFNNLGFLRSDALTLPVHKITQDDTNEAVEAYQNINDQVISVFGIEESFLAQQKMKQDIAILKLDFIINGKRSKRTEWRIKEAEMGTSEQNETMKNEMEKEIEIISKSLGNGIINPKEYTIYQYLIAKNSLKNGK